MIHYADQGRKGIARVEQTVREIETSFDKRLAESDARVLCYIPSGHVWNIIKDEKIREAFFRSHCVVPTRIVYPDMERSLNGARLYVYENNHHGQENKWIDLFEEGGDLHFSTSYGDLFSSRNGFTLGTARLQEQLIEDVSLPFSGTTGEVALISFALDLVLSPARISIESEDGKVLGFKDDKMHSDPELGYVCPWLDNYLLVRSDAKLNSRTIIGNDDGTYSYITVHPNGRSVVIKDAECSRNTRDKIIMDQQYGRIELEASEQKKLDIHVGDERPDGSVRYLNVRCDFMQGEATVVSLGDNLDRIDIQTPNREIPVHVELATFVDDQVTEERTLDQVVPAGKSLVLPLGLWSDLQQFQAETR